MTRPAETPVPEALARVLAACPPLPAETVALPDAFDRVLACPVIARLTQPPFTAAAMDGWAVRADDIAVASDARPVELRRIGEAAAGRPFVGRLDRGETVRVFTGAVLPDGADAVVMQEHAEDRGTAAAFRSPAGKRHVRPAGLDFAAGDEVLPAGRRMTARDVALAATANAPWLRVRRRPVVAVLATGDEIVLPGEPLRPGGLVSSNALGLCALVAGQGGTARHLGVAGDDPDALVAGLAAAAGADLLVTTGGAAGGVYDLVRRSMEAVEVERVAMRPGGAVMFGRIGGLPWLGLPGNPVATAITAMVLLVPALRAFQGLAPPPMAPRSRLGAALPATGARHEYLVAALSDGVVTAFPSQDSALTAQFARADALIVRVPHRPALDAGAEVPILPLP